MKKSGLACLALFVGLVAGCSLFPFSYEAYAYSVLNTADFEREEGVGCFKAGSFSPVSSADESFASYSDVYRDKVGDANYSWRINLPSTGEQKLLVIPVDFSDYPSSNLPDDSLDMVRESFFGSEKNNQYFSVASFFDKASYGRLHLQGKVTSWFTSSGYTYASLKNLSGSSGNTVALKSLRAEALQWYASAYPDDPLSNYSFPIDGYGKAVAVYLVYSMPNLSSESSGHRDSMLWAFTINNPAPTAWSSFGLTYLSDGKVDSHTFIHETGHIMGLKDYYDVNGGSDFGACAPTGRMDMMDYSIGDETGYSKLILDWTRPYVATSSCEVTLRPFSSSGDLLLLSPSWNGSPFDEYLLLEFYVPSYLNYVDATLRNNGERLFQKPGVKVYHVDSRLGYFDKVSLKGYLQDDIATASSYKVDVANDNSALVSEDYVDTSNLLYQLLDKSSGSAKLIKDYVASDHTETLSDGSNLRDSLFYEGDGFGEDSFLDFSFHDGAAFPFTFRISALTSTFAKIAVTME